MPATPRKPRDESQAAKAVIDFLIEKYDEPAEAPIPARDRVVVVPSARKARRAQPSQQVAG